MRPRIQVSADRVFAGVIGTRCMNTIFLRIGPKNGVFIIISQMFTLGGLPSLFFSPTSHALHSCLD